MIGVSIVLFHSPLPALAHCLRALDEQSLPLGRLYVHVNDAEPSYVQQVRELLSATRLTVDLVEDAANAGFAGAHDAGLEHLLAAGCHDVIVLNPDVALAADALAILSDFVRDRRACLAGPVLLRADPTTLKPDGAVDSLGIRWTRDGRHFDIGHGDAAVDLPTSPRRVRGISGACLLVTDGAHRTVVDRTGEFFDPLFIAYREDADLALRAEAIGIPMWLVPDAVGLHVRTVRGADRTSPTANRLGVQNRFLLALKHGSRRPGGRLLAPLRDVVVVAAVLTVERESLPGLRRAWSLRREMRTKARRCR